MTRQVMVLVEVPIPLDRIAAALGASMKVAPTRGRSRQATEKLDASIERVVSALDHLEKSSRTPGEGAARDALMSAVRGLRKAHILNRRK